MPRKTAGRIVPRKSPSKDSNGGKLGQFTREVKKTKDDAAKAKEIDMQAAIVKREEELREEGRQEVEVKWAESEKSLVDSHLVAIAQIRKEHLEEMQRSAGKVRAIIEDEKAKSYHEGRATMDAFAQVRYTQGIERGTIVGRNEGYASGVKETAKARFLSGLVIGTAITLIAAFIAIQFR